VPIIAHKGSLRPLVRVGGRTAHSGTPDLGINAIFEAGRLLPRLAAYHRGLDARAHKLVGQPSLTVTRASAGIADNIVPDSCDLLLDRRLVPGETEAGALAEITALLAAACAEDGIASEILRLQPTTGGAAETRADHPIVLAALAAGRRHGIAEPQPIGFQGACDFVHFRDIGAEGVVLGPGDLAVAHKPDEFVPRAELEAAALIYRDIALAMLAR
jgi:succinyl-diaminopimelate desuccinylase